MLSEPPNNIALSLFFSMTKDTLYFKILNSLSIEFKTKFQVNNIIFHKKYDNLKIS